MKTSKKLIAAAFFVFAIPAFSQVTPAEVLKPETKVTWLGLDFSKAKLIDDMGGFGTPAEAHNMLTAWNDLMVAEKEKEKYDVGKAIDRGPLESSIDATLKHNDALPAEDLLSKNINDYSHLQRADLDGIVSSYNFGSASGVGVMFIVESFSKIDASASIWVTFIDIGSRKIIFSEKVEGKPKGFGLRNFWGGAIYDVLKKIKADEYKAWKKKYGAK